MRNGESMKKMSSLLIVFLLVISLFVGVVQAQETEQEAEEGIEELEIEDVDAEVTTMEESYVKTEYRRTYYLMTEKILTAEAVIEFLNENFPNVETSSIETYKVELESIRASLTEESDFETVHDEVVALINTAREETKEIMDTNDVELSEVVEAVAEYKEKATEDDEAKEAWGEARSGYAHAKATVILARLHNFEKVADHYTDSEKVEELRIIIEELESIAEEIATAAGSFDKESVDNLVAEATELILQAKEIAKETREEVRDAHKVEMAELKGVAKEAREAEDSKED